MITPYMAMTPGEEEVDEKNIIFDEKVKKGSVKKANTVCCTIFWERKLLTEKNVSEMKETIRPTKLITKVLEKEFNKNIYSNSFLLFYFIYFYL